MSEGYGYSEFGYGEYGSFDAPTPEVVSVRSLDGSRILVEFSLPMLDNAALVSTASYTITANLGADTTVQSVAVTSGTEVTLTVSGTTLGGQYILVVSGPVSEDGVPVSETPTAFYSLGQDLTVEVSQSPGQATLTLKDELDRVVSLLDNGFDTDTGSYVFAEVDYPVPPNLTGVARGGDDSVVLTVGQVTSLDYQVTMGPSEAFVFEDSTLLDGTEVGTGTSDLDGDYLVLDKAGAGVDYGWFYPDDSGRLTPACSFLTSVTIDATEASEGTSLVVTVSDGDKQVVLTLSGGSLGIDAGGASASPAFDWTAAAFDLTVLRNQQAGLCSVLINGEPVYSFDSSLLTNPADFDPGVALILPAGVSSSGLKFGFVTGQASETIYTAAWNFVFTLVFGFTGIAALANDRIQAKRGPLVKAWGDWTPASREDVTVRVNGVSVDVADVNPYTGEIFPVVPIPLFPAGFATVEVDYCWIANPIFGLTGLNTRGLTLNTWARANGRTAEPTPPALPVGSFGLSGFGSSPFGAGSQNPATPVNYTYGVVNPLRYPYSVTLGQAAWQPAPKRVGHTYIGYQREYSALTNDPTTLLLNKNPHAIADGALTATSVKQTGRFSGTGTPISRGWLLTGTDTGAVYGGGLYRLVDGVAGDYPGGTAGFYQRALDLALPTYVQASARFRVSSVGTYDGVFSGVALGVYDGGRLALVGALLVNDVQHFGLLLDGNRPDLEESWAIGPSATATATSSTTVTISASAYPAGFGQGSRFRIASGPQAGVYTVSNCGVETLTSGGVKLTFTPGLPEDINLYGNNPFEIVFETLWSSTDLNAVRMLFDSVTGGVTAYLTGRVSGTIGSITAPAYPAETGLLLPATTVGGCLFGSVSRRAANESLWELAQYTAYPVAITQNVNGVYVLCDMTTSPEEQWFITGGFGSGDLTSGELVLDATAKSSVLDFEFGYSRVEPHLTNKVTTDFLATVTMTTGTLGAGDFALRIRDTIREALLVPILYRETATLRQLVTDIPSLSVSGLQSPELEGWVRTSGDALVSAWGQSLTTSGTGGVWTQTATQPTTCSYEGAVATTRFSVDGTTPSFGTRVKTGAGTGRYVGVAFPATDTLALVNAVGTVIAGPFAGVTWDDGGEHEYRVVCDPDSDLVTVFFDSVLIGSVALSGFTATDDAFVATFGMSGAGSIEWHSFTVCPLRPLALAGQTLGRTFGIRTGSDPDSIDSYTIPRDDFTNAANSSLTAVPHVMDWTVACELRLYMDPSWGVCFYRPDLPLPPNAISDSYSTETVNPTDAWASVEYRRLPKHLQDRGEISWGSLDSRSVSRSTWDDVSYRVRARPYGYGIAPTGMVLNRAITVTSGDWNLDRTPEVHLIPARENNTVYVSDSAIFADRVFLVRVEGVAVPASNWTFDASTQVLALAQTVAYGALVEVTFAPAKPQTRSYQCSRPIDETVTVLNEGTPPVPKSRANAITRTVTSDPSGDLISFSYGEDSLYAGVEFCENPTGDNVPLSSMCDGTNVAEIGIAGRLTTDAHSVSGGYAGTFRGSPTFRGSAMHFGGVSLIASGGRRPPPTNGILNAGLTYPNAAGSRGMGVNQDFALSLHDTQEETWELTTAMGDNTAPDGTVGTHGHGACTAVISDLPTLSRLGPMGGLSGLTLLAGGGALTTGAFTLNGGGALPSPVITQVVLQAAN